MKIDIEHFECRAFLELAVAIIQQDLSSKLNECNYFSFLMDGSQIRKKKIGPEGEFIYVQYVDPITKQVCVDFVSMASMQEYGCVNADALLDTLTRELVKLVLISQQNHENSGQ